MLTRQKWEIIMPWPGTVAGEVFSSLDKVFAMDAESISCDSESTVFSIVVEGHCFYVKCYHATKGIRSWLGKARIRMEAKNQLWFNQIGLPAARVVAFGEEFFLSKTLRGALVTEGLKNTADLSWTAEHKPQYFADRLWRNQVIQQLAEITRTLHQHRFCHNDLKWRNILVTQDRVQPKLYLIDCPVGQTFCWPLLKRRIIKDLACLDKVAKYRMSRTQRLKFYLVYKKQDHLLPVDKPVIKKVLSYFVGRE